MKLLAKRKISEPIDMDVLDNPPDIDIVVMEKPPKKHKKMKSLVESKMDWYSTLEEPIRELVKLLRDNGFNTKSSCGHEKTIQLDLDNMSDMENIGTFLIENNVKEFSISGFLDNIGGRYWRRSCEVKIYD